MAMDAADFAQYVHDEMAFPDSPSDILKGWCQAIMDELLTNAVVANAPGTITGQAPPSGGSLLNGEGSDGLIADLDEANLADNIAANTGKPKTADVENFAAAITEHIMTLGRVVFASGNITGVCTNTPPPPPPGLPGTFTGSGSDGEVQDLDGPTLALLVKDKVGYPSVTPELETYCTAIVDYIMDNAEVTYTLCTGTAPAGGGDIIAGTAAAGIIL